MFNAKKETQRIIEFIKEYYTKNNLKGAVLGISGGKDSAVVAGLFAKAIGPENVIGVSLPCHSASLDRSDAEVVADAFGFRLYNLDLTNVFDEFKKSFNAGFGELVTDDLLKDADINLKPRLRMASVYYITQFFSAYAGKGYLVTGTSNLCERFVGYFTKGGDNVCDISVLGNLTVEEVISVGDYIGVPNQVLYKTPSDGLSNQSDEDKLGVKYSEIAQYIKDGKLEDEEVSEKIRRLHERNLHKFTIPTFEKEETNPEITE